MLNEDFASKIKLLPAYHILTVEEERWSTQQWSVLTGILSEPIGEPPFGTLLVTLDMKFLSGIFMPNAFNPLVRRFKQNYNREHDLTASEYIGRSLYVYPGRLDSVRLILDSGIRWERTEFVSRPILDFCGTREDGTSWRMTRPLNPGEVVPEAATLIEDPFDHVHCTFCTARIDQGEYGYFNQQSPSRDAWSCTWCHDSAIAKRDLRALLIPRSQRVTS